MNSFNLENALFLHTAYLRQYEKIICICVGKLHLKDSIYLNLRTFYNEDEDKLLLEFKSFLDRFPRETLLCASNSIRQEYPIIYQKMINNNIEIPCILKASPELVPESNSVEEYKTIANYVNENEPELIIDHCMNKVVVVAQLLLRFNNIRGVSTENIYYV